MRVAGSMDGGGSRRFVFKIPAAASHSIINNKPKEEVNECIEK